MKEKIQKLLEILFPNGNYVKCEDSNDCRFVGYTNVFQLTDMETVDIWSHIVEVVNYDEEEIAINVLPTIIENEWLGENKDIIKGALAAIIHILFNVEKWHEVTYNEKGMFMSAYIKTKQ